MKHVAESNFSPKISLFLILHTQINYFSQPSLQLNVTMWLSSPHWNVYRNDVWHFGANIFKKWVFPSMLFPLLLAVCRWWWDIMMRKLEDGKSRGPWNTTWKRDIQTRSTHLGLSHEWEINFYYVYTFEGLFDIEVKPTLTVSLLGLP